MNTKEVDDRLLDLVVALNRLLEKVDGKPRKLGARERLVIAMRNCRRWVKARWKDLRDLVG